MKNAPKAFDSCSTVNDFSKYRNGEERTSYFLVTYIVYVVGSVEQLCDIPLVYDVAIILKVPIILYYGVPTRHEWQ